MVRLLASFAAIPMALLCSCSASPSVNTKSKIVATFSVLGDWAKQVAGERFEVVMLVGSDADAHTFEPTPQNVAAMGDAKLIVANGTGFETWLDKAVASSGSKARRVTVSEGLTLLTGACEHCKAKSGQEHKHDHDDEPDPHIWHDVANAKFGVAKIRDALMQLDPEHAEEFKSNAAAYLQKLDALDRWILAEVMRLPPNCRKIVTSHDTFGYFAKRYGFEVIGTAIGSFSTEAADPSSVEFAKLLKTIQGARVPAIFCENMHNPKLMQHLAAETRVTLAPELSTDALGPSGSPGETYDAMMRHNVTVMVEALKP